MEGGEPVTLAEVPSSSKRLLISWGLGNELHCVDLQPSGSAEESTASTVQWCGQPSPLPALAAALLFAEGMWERL